ncbi:unnamed protein product [Calypogeia fissa]
MALHVLSSVSVPLPANLAAPSFCNGRLFHNSGICSSGWCSQKLSGARCSATSEKSGNRTGSESAPKTALPIRDFYELLGVPIEATSGEIRQAYRNLQKKHHPDIAGKKGHAMTLLLNEAYQTLMDDNLRIAYNTAHSYKQAMKGFRHKTFTGSPYSTWVGPDRPQGIFVDENVCVGCRECVHVASNTFTMDENTGCARVKAQWADPEPFVKMAREACPVNCIHLVEREDLAFLEFLIRPQPKPSNGIYGGGWERTRNVFTAAATLKRQAEEKKVTASSSAGKETAAQMRARVAADLQLRMGPLWKLWSWAGQPSAKEWSYKDSPQSGNEWSWKGLFGRSSTSDVLILPVSKENVAKTVAVVQEWASTFASSSELPLPMPFRTDSLPNGVQLTLISASNGTISSVGSLVVTVGEMSVPEKVALGEPFDAEAEDQDDKESFLRVRREGTTGTGALPGEGRIVKALKEAILGRDKAYNAYHLNRQ